MLHGVDLSHHNDDPVPINFDLLRGHVDFVIAKITQGIDFVDPNGAWHVSETRRIGAVPGLYHFPDWGNALSEADYFCAHAGDIAGAFVGFDCERIPAGFDPVSWTLAFCGRVRSSLGINPLVYLNKSALRGYDWSPVISANYGLWEANYDGNATDFSLTGAWPAVAFKQYRSDGSEPGITGNVDEDEFNGDLSQLLRYCKAAAPVPAPVPVPAPAPAPVPAPAPPGSFLPTLSYGMRGNRSVSRLQGFLASNFPDYRHAHGDLPATGNYLDVTRAWVLEFQTRAGVRNGDGSRPDGKTVGHNTNAALWRFGYRG